jgi:hypothetical protein
MTHDHATFNVKLNVTPETKIADVLSRYGDVASIMETLGVKRVAGFDVRRLLGKLITVKWAARVHGLPLEEMVGRLQSAINQSERARSNSEA